MNKLIFSLFVVILLTSILFVMNFKKPISNLSHDDIPKTVVKPYKPDLNYPDLVIEAIEKALKENKQPLIIFGANWCPDCRIFSGTMNIPKIENHINEKFDVLYIDVLRYEINMDLMEEFGIASAEGIPRVLVFDKNKNVINNSNTTEWRTARDRTSQEIFDFFQNMVTN